MHYLVRKLGKSAVVVKANLTYHGARTALNNALREREDEETQFAIVRDPDDLSGAIWHG